MRQYHLTIASKTKKTLDDFLKFLNNPRVNFFIIKKNFKNKKTKKVFTILKSPHVYKTAQEQFQSNFFSKKITIHSNLTLFLIFIKKIKNDLFPDLKTKIKFSVNENLSSKTRTLILNPSNFKSNILNKTLNQKYRTKTTNKKNYKQTEHLLKIFDSYSELLEKIVWVAQLVRAKD